MPEEIQMENSIGDVSCAGRHKIAAAMCSLPGRGTGIIPIWDGSALKRMIYTVPKEEAEGAFCSKCAGHDG